MGTCHVTHNYTATRRQFAANAKFRAANPPFTHVHLQARIAALHSVCTYACAHIYRRHATLVANLRRLLSSEAKVVSCCDGYTFLSPASAYTRACVLFPLSRLPMLCLTAVASTAESVLD